MLETLKTLCSLGGVSGSEDEVREYILARCLPYADSIDTDALGSLCIFKRGAVAPAKEIMLCAHMDEVGLIVTSIDECGVLRFDCVGGIDRRVLIGKRVLVGKNKLPGVIGIKPVHLTEGDETKQTPKVDELYIDIGARSRESAESLVELGDVCLFDTQPEEIGSLLKARAIDDRVGCAAMIKLIESEPPCDCRFVFTVQEEVGCRGAAAAAARVKPYAALILEGTTATDTPDLGEGKVICRAGEGICIPVMDGGTIYDRELSAELRGCADALGIAHQTKRRITGGTDASAVQRSTQGVRVACAAVPVRNIHSPASMAHFSEIEALPQLALAFLRRCAEIFAE
ncbi:MAG: M20/M25/M40 family metallo-hydrolase [Oscillospiraceae bacterium]|nr:M20/M25/M40 family metallo-hydrolase [Oscillospiraceae bacterium]